MLDITLYLHDLILRSFGDKETPHPWGVPVASIVVPNASAPSLTDREKAQADTLPKESHFPGQAATIEVLLLGPGPAGDDALVSNAHGSQVKDGGCYARLDDSLLVPSSVVVVQLHGGRGAGVFHVRSMLTRPVAGGAVGHQGIRIRPVGAMEYPKWTAYAQEALQTAWDRFENELVNPPWMGEGRTMREWAPLSFQPRSQLDSIIDDWLRERTPPHLSSLQLQWLPEPLNWTEYRWPPGPLNETEHETWVFLAALPQGGTSQILLKVYLDARPMAPAMAPGGWQWCLVRDGITSSQPSTNAKGYDTPEDAKAAAGAWATQQGMRPLVNPAIPLRMAYMNDTKHVPQRGEVVPLAIAQGYDHPANWPIGAPVTCDPGFMAYAVPAEKIKGLDPRFIAGTVEAPPNPKGGRHAFVVQVRITAPAVMLIPPPLAPMDQNRVGLRASLGVSGTNSPDQIAITWKRRGGSPMLRTPMGGCQPLASALPLPQEGGGTIHDLLQEDEQEFITLAPAFNRIRAVLR